MKSAGVVLLGAAQAAFSLSHFNEIMAALTGTMTFAIVAMKFYRSLRKTFAPDKKQVTETKQEETTV